jgi:hypothetical protein
MDDDVRPERGREAFDGAGVPEVERGVAVVRVRRRPA